MFEASGSGVCRVCDGESSVLSRTCSPLRGCSSSRLAGWLALPGDAVVLVKEERDPAGSVGSRGGTQSPALPLSAMLWLDCSSEASPEM